MKLFDEMNFVLPVIIIFVDAIFFSLKMSVVFLCLFDYPYVKQFENYCTINPFTIQ